MATAQVKSVMPGVVVRSGARSRSIRFSCMINGNRYTKTLDVPAELMLTDDDRPTRDLRSEYGRWVAECTAKSGAKKGTGLRVPTIRELIETYEDIAWKRQGDPRFRKSDRTIETAVKNFKYCVEASGLRDSRPYTDLVDFDTVRRMANHFVLDKEHGGKGLASTSAWSYIASLQSVTARWTIAEYRDRGFVVDAQVITKQSLFGKAADPKQYEELPRETVREIWDWYLNIRTHENASYAFYAACMLELAIRPGDIGQLTAENFPVDPNGHHRLAYRPAKTRESSNRRVDIEIPDALWEHLYSLKKEEFDDGEILVPHLRWTEHSINESLRKIPGLATKQKASYELRKLCIHTILVTPVEQGGGIDQAVRLSGDRRDTIEKYYCDPYKSHTALPASPLAAFLGVEPSCEK